MEKFNLDITIQQNSGTTTDSFGQQVELWTDVFSTFAAMITTGGREYYAAQKLNAETTAVFKIWYQAGITTLMRIKYGERYFNILSANDVDEKHEYILISGKEVV